MSTYSNRPGASTGRRVALVVNVLALGGAENQVVQLARALVTGGDHVAVLSILPPLAWTEELHELGVAVHVVGGEGPTAVDTLRRSVRALREFRPDALISFTYHANALGILAGRL